MLSVRIDARAFSQYSRAPARITQFQFGLSKQGGYDESGHSVLLSHANDLGFLAENLCEKACAIPR